MHTFAVVAALPASQQRYAPVPAPDAEPAPAALLASQRDGLLHGPWLHAPLRAQQPTM